MRLDKPAPVNVELKDIKCIHNVGVPNILGGQTNVIVFMEPATHQTFLLITTTHGFEYKVGKSYSISAKLDEDTRKLSDVKSLNKSTITTPTSVCKPEKLDPITVDELIKTIEAINEEMNNDSIPSIRKLEEAKVAINKLQNMKVNNSPEKPDAIDVLFGKADYKTSE